ncbi:hypothetical protein IQ64_26850 [Streptomyces stelliscabiei]|nr:hypothetical protein IQ64_26850 [Streptomyces stelliscabiei]
MLVEVDPEVRGQDQRETAALLEGGLFLMGGEVGADERRGCAVDGGVKAVRGAATGEAGERGRRCGGGGVAYCGDVQAEVGAVAGEAPFAGAGGEEEAQPLEGAGDKTLSHLVSLR